MTNLAVVDGAMRGRERFVIHDEIDAASLPDIPVIPPTYDPAPILEMLGIEGGHLATKRVKSFANIRPPEVSTWDDIGLNLPKLNDIARSDPDHGPKFQKVLRMGGIYNRHLETMPVEDAEALAVGTMGLHSTLRSHGAAQAKEGFDLVTMQQKVHYEFWRDIVSMYGKTRAAIDAYARFSQCVPNFSYADVRDILITADIHDYGEAELGVDVPYEAKNDPHYSIVESSAAVALATDLHTPTDSRLMRLLEARAMQGKNLDPEFNQAYFEDIGHLLHPLEIRRAIWGTERQGHGQLLRGDAFGPTIERKEYVLSGLLAFQAIEHNINGVWADTQLHAGLGRLGVSSMFNSLPTLAGRAEKYVGAYDFLRRNEATIDKYMAEVVKVIVEGIDPLHQKGDTIFQVDPFNNYRTKENRPKMINRAQARRNFMATVEFWKQWKRKQHIARALWETYIGADDDMEGRLDVPFIELTAAGTPQHRRRKGNKVRILKPLKVMGFSPVTA